MKNRKVVPISEGIKEFKLSWPTRTIRTVLAISLWTLLFIDILVFDLSSILIRDNRFLAIVFQFRFLILMVTLAILLVILPRPKFTAFVLYIIFFPLIVLIWIIPKTILKNWFILVVFLPAMHSIITNYRINFLLITLAIMAGSLILFSQNNIAIYISMLFLSYYLIRHYYRRFRMAFVPSTAFADVGNVMNCLWETIQENTNLSKLNELQSGDERYNTQYAQEMLNIYMFSTLFSIFGRRLKNIHESRQLDLYLIVAIFYSILLTIFMYSFLFYGLHKAVPASFAGPVSFSNMIGYSIGTIMHYQISPIYPVTYFAQMLTYSEVMASAMIIVLFAFLIFTSIRERYKVDLQKVVENIESTNSKIEKILTSDYSTTIKAVELMLYEYNAFIVRTLISWRSGQKAAKLIEKELSEKNMPIPDQPQPK